MIVFRFQWFIINYLIVVFLFSGDNFWNYLKYPFNRNKQHADNIEDVFDGRLYKERFHDGFFVGTADDAKKQEIHKVTHCPGS